LTHLNAPTHCQSCQHFWKRCPLNSTKPSLVGHCQETFRTKQRKFKLFKALAQIIRGKSSRSYYTLCILAWHGRVSD
jgi:hypothetical protein